ncbi:YrhC family protein [Sediminibacillus halophilus]|uniref:YrhC-like protein n=1 Tax=Sediminibacillus halophilus TaxID=482461 RepID=A0A1G9XUH4_9BACI|nr:YrhC family protein [Sediminibacillus halophilus]SDN00448.1 YrhC-like protein [Sediminibacillus halophilus]
MKQQEAKLIEERIEDFGRFLVTLLMLSAFFYLGMIINYYLEPMDNGGLLPTILILTIMAAGWIAVLLKKWQRDLNSLME